MDDPIANFNEQDARRVLLVQAIETGDASGKLLSQAERTQAEQAVVARLRQAGQPSPEPAAFLAARAAELLHTVEARHPALARLESRDPWWDRLGVLLPVLALVAGFASHRLFNWGRTDLLSPPLLGVIAWNLCVYLLLAVSVVRTPGQGGFLRWLSEVPSWFSRRAVARVRTSAQLQFRMLWWRAAGALEGARLQQLMHLSAAAWALGVVLAIVVAGIATRFNVGWESTWLGAEGVHRVVSVMALPARAIGIAGFTLEQVRQLEFVPGAVPPQEVARRWALIYIVFLVATVVLPRLLLWAWARYKVRTLGRSVRVDLSGDYFNDVLARVRTARLVVSLRGPDSPLKEAAYALLAQAVPGGTLTTAQGDRLEVDRAGLPADVVWWVVPADTEAGQVKAQLGGIAPGQKVLVLCQHADAVPELQSQTGADVLALADCGACWAVEGPLHRWLVDNAATPKRPGVERLVEAWTAAHADRFDASMQLLTGVLAASAADSQDVAGLLPGGKDRDAAFAQLLDRVQQRLDALHAQLVQLHGVQATALRQPIGPGSVRAQNLGQAGAGAAGAVAGALAGAKVDLLTGGLSMGAGMALGAALGGAGIFTAARWWLLGGKAKLGDDQVQSLVDLLVLQYLAVVHAGRARDLGDAKLPATWDSETVAAVAAVAPEFKKCLKQAQNADPAGVAQLQELLRRAVWQVLGGLYGPASLRAWLSLRA